MRNPIAVANKILEVAKGTDDPYVTPMQLIKLTYLCHGWMLGLVGRPLLNESVQAWRYGPVVKSLYDAVKNYKDQPVTSPISVNIFGHVPKNDLDATDNDIIEQVYNIYGHWDGIALSALTHKQGTPWEITWMQHGQNAVISNDLIENHYKRLYGELTSQNANAAAG